MADDDGSSEPVDLLVDTLARTVPIWLTDCVVRTAHQAYGRCPDDLADGAARMAHEQAPEVVARIETLVRTDVDLQRTNPLSLLRDAVHGPTELLRAADVPPVRRDAFAVERFPDDVYDLGPASWADVHPDLHEVGIMWGAWKAATVLQRRREEGRR